jgi:hypothetical protein
VTQRLAVVVGLLIGGAAALQAQASNQPNLVLSISGGLTMGGELWTLPRQLVSAPFGEYDTLTLGRRLRPGVVAVLGAAYHRGPHLGMTFEVGYFGVASEGRCSPNGPYSFDSDDKNAQACDATQGRHFATSLIGFQAGLVYNFLVRRTVTPYVRATGGIASLGASYVETVVPITAAACPGTTCSYALLFDGGRKGATVVGTLAAGLTIGLWPGYQLRFEARDLIARLPVAADSAMPGSPNFPTARVGLRTLHIPTITTGLDVVLERRHRRRY